MIEEWRDIKGYEGIYQVSNLGRVKSLAHTYTRRSWSSKSEHILSTSEKVLTPLNVGRYLRIGLTDDKHKTIQYSIHRLVAEAFIPNPENLPEVNHLDCNGHNNDVRNLEWCSHYDNVHYLPSSESRKEGVKRNWKYRKEIYGSTGKRH